MSGAQRAELDAVDLDALPGGEARVHPGVGG